MMPPKKRSAAPTKPAVDQPWSIDRARAIADKLAGYSHVPSAIEARNAIAYLIAENERLAVTVAAHTNGTAATLVRGIGTHTRETPMTKIEWTDATWNPTTGCDRVSAGCDQCYALTMAKRLNAMGHSKYQNDGDPRTSGPGFALTLHADTLYLPRKWHKPRRVFVNSMSDLFHNDVPDAFIRDVFSTMRDCPQHTFQILTKRSQRMRQLMLRRWQLGNDAYINAPIRLPLPNVWLGTSIESDNYTWRANHLRATPAAIRFLSLEPLIGPLPSLSLAGIDWVIVGGESGHGARPMHPDWARRIRDLCVDAGVPFFFKQWGAWWPESQSTFTLAEAERVAHVEIDSEHFYRVGKTRAGRELDGRTWDEYPRASDDVHSIGRA